MRRQHDVATATATFTESKKNYVLIEKNEILVVQSISPLNFAKYLSYSEVQKNRNIVNNWNRFQQGGCLF